MKTQFKNVHKAFGDNKVLRGVDFSIEAESVHFVLGRSGAGKSVISKLMVGLLSADSGEIWIGDSAVHNFGEKEFLALRRRCQYVFQHATLFDGLNALQNVALAARKRFLLSAKEAEARALDALEKVGAQNVAKRYPASLGLGIQKRIAIARALVMKPSMILYDEPTTALDPGAARQIDHLIQRLSVDEGVTSVVVSHDMQSVETIADRLCFLSEGTMVFSGKAQDLGHAQHPEVEAFVTAARRFRPQAFRGGALGA